MLLPFGRVGTPSLAAALLTAILACAFFGLDVLREKREEPISESASALPLGALVRGTEIAGCKSLDETNLPVASSAVDFVLFSRNGRRCVVHGQATQADDYKVVRS